MRLTSGLILLATVAGLLLPAAVVADDSAAIVSAPSGRKSARRLPAEIVPVSYDLKLKPDLDAGTFEGSETINIKLAEAAQRIYLNAKELNVTEATVSAAGGSVEGAQKAQVEVLAGDEMIALATGNQLPAGEYVLHLRYNAKLNDKLVGFYKASFKDKAGKTHPLAATQFEPADARRMLPCFDEPQMKARFKIQVDIKKEYVAIANGATERNVITDSGRRIVQFAETPPMSSYLLALVIGEFRATPPVVVNNVPIRVWAVAGKSDLGIYSRDTAVKMLPALTSYFGVSYPWRKLDLVAVPDFEAGAMENPGCITFRETLLLIDPKTASSPTMRSCAGVIAHEMAHLWFGDLVTMKWWDDLWLNEAFATFMATRIVNTVHPEWDSWKDYIEDRVAALRTDGLHATRAIHAPVSSPDQAIEMFDVITYEKGCSVLRMLERYVGEKKFQAGINRYLTDHSFANATTEQLWEAIATASGAPVKEVMNGWVHQPGYPIVSVQHPVPYNSRFSVKQNRFFLAGEDASDMSVWDVPIGVRSLATPPSKSNQSPAKETLLVNSPEKAFEAVSAASGPFFANAGAVGYYRVRYSPEDSRLIRSKLANLDPGERLAFLDDSWNLALAGQIPISDYLELLSSYRNESDDIVMERIVSSLSSLSYFVSDACRPSFEKFVLQTLTPVQRQLGWQAKPGESQRRRILRGQIIETLGMLGQDQPTIARARQLFSKYIKERTAVDPDLVSAIFHIVAYNGKARDYEMIKRLYQVAKTPEDEHRSLFTLAYFWSPDLVNKTMTMAVDGTVRIQDAPHLLGTLLQRRKTGPQAWKFIQANWDKITSRYSEPMIPGLVSHASGFNTSEYYDQVKAFVTAHPLPSGESATKRLLENIQINVGFRQRSAQSLNDWLRKHES